MRERGPDWVTLGVSGGALALILGMMVKTNVEQQKPPTPQTTGEARPAPAPKPPPSTLKAKVIFLPTVTRLR